MNKPSSLGPMADKLQWVASGSNPARGSNQIQQIETDLIDESDRFQLRYPPYPNVDGLALDIKERGQTTPIFVRPKEDGRFELISGYRRMAAVRSLGAPMALARIFEALSDQDAYDLAISENQERENLTDIERAAACLRLQEEGRTHQEIAVRMGWDSERQAGRHLRLAKNASLPLREALQRRLMTMAQAMVFLDAIPETCPVETQKRIIDAAAENEFSARELEGFIRRQLKSVAPVVPATVQDEYIRVLKNGGFHVAAKFDPRTPEKIDEAINALQDALRRAKIFKRRMEKEIAQATEDVRV